MEIKLHARLKAYSKYNPEANTFPIPTEEDSGKFLGVNSQGEYVLFANASETKIDGLFNGTSNSSNSENKNLIDSLF